MARLRQSYGSGNAITPSTAGEAGSASSSSDVSKFIVDTPNCHRAAHGPSLDGANPVAGVEIVFASWATKSMGDLSALAQAVVLRDAARVSALVTEGHRVSWEPSPFEETPLHIAADNGDVPVLAILLDHGGEEYLDSLADGWTPLGFATLKGHADAVRLLLARGADPNKHDEEQAGDTPLVDAIDRGFEGIVTDLLAAGADPTIPGWMQLTHCTTRRNATANYRTSRVIVYSLPYRKPPRRPAADCGPSVPWTSARDLTFLVCKLASRSACKLNGRS
jgi:hypothetical protein